MFSEFQPCQWFEVTSTYLGQKFSLDVQAYDRDDAQDKAIERWEQMGIPHGNLTIRRHGRGD